MLKKIYYTLIIALLLVTLSACENDFDSLNTNPKAAINVPANSVFLAGQKSLVDVYTTSIWTSSPFRVLSQTWIQVANINEARYQFSSNNAPGGWWTRIYTCLLYTSDNAGTVHDKLKVVGAELVRKTIDMVIANQVNAEEQTNLMGTETVLKSAPKIFKETCEIDIQQSVYQVHNFVRGLSPHPTAWISVLIP